MKKILILICIALPAVFAAGSAVNARDDQASAMKWRLKAGIKESISTGLYDPSCYTKPYATGEVTWDYLLLSAGTSCLLGYPLYDGSGNEKKVTLYTLSAEAGIWYLNDFGGGIRYTAGGGESSYSNHEITGSAGYMGDLFSLDLELTWSATKYEFNGNLDTHTISGAAEGSWFFSDSYSLDCGITIVRTTSDALDMTYDRGTLRGGITGDINPYLFLMTGISFGRDTNDYSIYGLDATVAILPTRHVKITLMYMISYNAGPGVASSGSGAPGGSTLLTSGSYLSQRILLGMEGRI